MFGDEYYIKLMFIPEGKIKPETLWENYIRMEEEETSRMEDVEFVDAVRGYLPQTFFEESDLIRVYGINPSVGDLILVREVDIEHPSKDLIGEDSTKQVGLKYDNGKPLVGDVLQIFGEAIMAVGECVLEGQKKYPTIDNWKKVENAQQRYTNALIRHLIKHLSGKEIDEESGLKHIQHVAWNALAICQLYLEKKGK